jgi:iron(II)-dependent oxidoreductase
VLAELGDPRPEVMTLEGMEFCLVPAGPFRMGNDIQEKDFLKDEGPEHQVEIPFDFFLGRYPVTVAQFQEYAERSQARLRNPDAFRGSANAPVVGVIWNEAKEFCAWLTKKWTEEGLIQGGWSVLLPSEAEWEKAARGGLEIPVKVQVGSLGAAAMDGRLKRNPEPAGRYPWGAESDPERANYGETGIGAVSAVGCFPRGVSPYGCEEMSGNVWEWTRSLYEPYPHPEAGRKRNSREDLTEEGFPVVRGGSYFDASGFVRCAVRYRSNPNYLYAELGFRVALLPFSMVLKSQDHEALVRIPP